MRLWCLLKKKGKKIMSDKEKNEDKILEALRLLNIQTVPTGEGEFEFKIDVSEEFEAWFKEDQGLSRWSEKRFNDWFRGVISSELPRVHAAILQNFGPRGLD